MNRRSLLWLPLLALPYVALAQTGGGTGPQPELPKEKLVIVTRDGKEHVFNVEMALTPEQQTTGEMFRTSIPDDGGMLFVLSCNRTSNGSLGACIVASDCSVLYCVWCIDEGEYRVHDT